MKNLFIVLLVVFGLCSVAIAQDPDISLAYITGSTGYLELYDNPTLSTASGWTTLDMIDVGRLPNGNTIAAYTVGSSEWMELYDPVGNAVPGASIQLDGLIAVSGLANGDIVAAYTSGSSDYVEIYDGITLTTTGASTSFETVMDVTGTQGGDVVVAYNAGGSSDWTEHYDLSMTAISGAFADFTGVEHVTGMANGDVAVYYGAATNYLQIFSGHEWTGGAWRVQQYARDIAGLANGDILIGYNTGGTADYLQAIDPTLTTWRDEFLSFEEDGITALEGDYLDVTPGGVAGDYNDNGVVDAADYTIYRDNLGGDSAALSGNGSGAATVVVADYDLWKQNFGSSGTGSTAAVPEPSALVLALVIPGLIACHRNRRWKGINNKDQNHVASL